MRSYSPTTKHRTSSFFRINLNHVYGLPNALPRMCHQALILLFVAITFSAVASQAQTVSGTLQGTITDTSGAVVPGMAVTIRNVETGLERNVTTSDAGLYISPNLPIGRYRISITGQGFGTNTREDVDITLNQTTVINFELNPSVTGDVVITASEAPINTSNAEVKGTLTDQQIIDRPSANTSNFLTLAETFTGFQENPTAGQNNPTTSSGSSINFNGTGTRGATFQINGVNNDDSSENQNRQGAAFSTIKEFQVISNNFTAEFGRGYGAVVLVQTKSGTNRLSGDVYLHNQNSGLNAKSAFTPTANKPVSRRNQYGGTFGLPFVKDKLFGFFSFDQTRLSGAQTFTRDLLLPNERTPRLTRGNDTPANRAFIQSIIDRFPTNLTPNDARSPRTYVASVGIDQPDDDYSVRMDWNARSSDTMFARYQYTRQIRDNEDIIIGEATRQNNKQQNLGYTWTHLFNATTVGEFRYGLGLRTTLVDIKAGNDTPIVRFTGTPVAGSIIGNAGAFPIQRFQTDHQFVYNLSTLVASNHFLKMGTDIRRQKLDDLAQSFGRPFYTFQNGLCGGVNYATPYDAFLDGCVTNFTRVFGNFFLENRINELNLYVEDNWKVRPNLTLNIGARYEYVSAPREARERIDYGFEDDKNNIMPRIAFAYSPSFKSGFLSTLTGGEGNSSIRAGYGVFHGRLFQSIFSQNGASIRENPPNAIRRTYNGRTVADFPNALNVADPTFGFVFTPTNSNVRRTEIRASPDLEMPYTQQWSLSVERQLPLASALRLTYAGNRGIGLIRYALDNLPVSPAAGGIVVPDHPNNPANLRGVLINRVAADVQCAGTNGTTIPFTAACPTVVQIAPNEVSLRVPRTNERRPDPRFFSNIFISNDAWSYYHGLQVEWNKKLTRGLTYQVAYTFSKSIDTTSDATFLGAGDTNQTGNDARTARGLSRFHTPHRFTINSTYVLPFFRTQQGFIGKVLGGWQISNVVRLASGTPFTVVDSGGIDLNFDGFPEGRPVILDPSILFRQVSNPNFSQDDLPRSAFRRATPDDFGNGSLLGRNTFYGDSTRRIDFSFFKNFALPFERQRLRLRVDMFNAFNTVQYGFPTTDLANVNFGRILLPNNLYVPRFMQLSARYEF